MSTPPLFFLDYVPLVDVVLLTGDEGRHAGQVLRVRPGEGLNLSDGRGALLGCVVREVRSDGVVLRVESRTVITMVKDHPDLHEVAEMHRPVIEAFRTQDRARCGRMLRKHIEHFAKWVPREAAADGDSPPGRPRVRRSAA